MADTRQTELLEEILAEQKALRGDVSGLKGDVSALKQGQAETQKRLETLEQGQQTLEHGIGALSTAVANAVTKLDTKIDKSQEETIDALKDLLLKPVDDHEERITTLEEEVGIKPRKH